jgi:hypothetical protein
MASIVTNDPDNSSIPSSFGMAVISLLFASTTAVPAEAESGLKMGKNGRSLRKGVNNGISSSVMRVGWRFASQDGNSVLGEKSRRDPASSARTTHSAEAQASLGRCVVRTLAVGI